MEKQRLDIALLERGLASSRSQARDLILRGLVSCDGAVVIRPALLVQPGDVIGVAEGAADHVSRGAVKLEAAIGAFGFDPAGLNALDVGASTGGFTEVLLARGAQRVIAVDVGRGQLHPRLAGDPRVVSLESCDARALTAAEVPEPPQAIVVDVSFVSATLVLPAVLALAASGCWLVVLVKPQFELEPSALGKGGIVRLAEDRQRALDRVRGFVEAQPGWRIVGTEASPIAGGSGNREWLLGAVLGVEGGASAA